MQPFLYVAKTPIERYFTVNARSIDLSLDEKQVRSQWTFELERFNSGYVYCPMCEVVHENNTFCQMSWSDWS